MEEEWYYCVEHGRVEPKFGCRMANRLGPYASREEAERALERVERRNEAWEEDPAWNDDTEDDT
ncbi:MAG: SPOR domain-containing protein [Actinomycetota bacterium]